MKQVLVLIKDEGTEGFMKDGIVGVNVQHIWNRAVGKENKRIVEHFAKLFSQTTAHETAHYIINKILNRYKRYKDGTWQRGEEKTIYKLLGEKWTRKEELFYQEYYE